MARAAYEDDQSRQMSVIGSAEAYKAAMKKDWEAFKKCCEEDSSIMTLPMTVAGNTALHIAVYSGDVQLVRDLLELTPFASSNERGDTILHEAAAVGNVKMAKHFILHDKKKAFGPSSSDTQLLKTKNKRGETPLFRAAAFNQTKMVRFLASKAEHMSIHRSRDDDTSILHITVLSKYFDTALALLQRDLTLRNRKDENGMTCFQLLANMPSAFKSGYSMNILEELLYFCLPDEDEDSNSDSDSDSENDNDNDNNNDNNNDNGNNDLDDDSVVVSPVTPRQGEDLDGGCGRSHPRQYFNYSNGRTAISRIYYTIWRCIAQGLPPIKRLWDIKKQQKSVLRLAKILRISDDTWMGTHLGREGPEKISVSEYSKVNKDDHDAESEAPFAVKVDSHSLTTSSSEPPIISAARNGIIEIVNLILDVYPQATEVTNDRGENIFHIAARFRRKEILDRLQYYLHAPLSRIGRKLNTDGDSILHQAAYQDKHQLRDRPGEALHMQSEIQWFKRVRKLVPPYFSHHRNNKNKTAEELFTEEHKQLVEKGQEWLMRTTKACTIVAVLIATVAFTCAYTIPGGSNPKTGHPLLLKATAFRTFTISDTLSLCFSLTSVVVFLSIMTSRMDEQDFRRSLPLKLVLGLTTLFFAVASMMVAFAATLMLVIRQRLHWAAIPIYSIACCPVTIFLALQFPLYLNIAWFTVSDILRSFIDSGFFGKCGIQSSGHYSST